MIRHFLCSDSGAVTVDWTVMTASVVGLGLASAAAVQTGVVSLGGDVESSLTGAAVAALPRFNALAVSLGFDGGLGDVTPTSGGANVLQYVNGPGSDGELGYMRFTDAASGVTWANLGAAFTGDHSDKFGGSLSFDINIQWTQTGGWLAANTRVVEIIGANGMMLTYVPTANPPIGEWSTISAPIEVGSLRLSNGTFATEAQIRAVLANVQSTNIRTEFFNNGEQIAFDNIQFR